jgi:hypothetical protein
MQGAIEPSLFDVRTVHINKCTKKLGARENRWSDLRLTVVAREKYDMSVWGCRRCKHGGYFRMLTPQRMKCLAVIYKVKPLSAMFAEA